MSDKNIIDAVLAELADKDSQFWQRNTDAIRDIVKSTLSEVDRTLSPNSDYTWVPVEDEPNENDEKLVIAYIAKLNNERDHVIIWTSAYRYKDGWGTQLYQNLEDAIAAAKENAERCY